MIRLNKATEYGLMALNYMESYSPAKKSAREIAEHLKLPFEITAKTLQRLKETGFVESTQGTNGGYTLTRPLQQFTLGELVEAIEGPQSLVACLSEAKSECGHTSGCEIKNPLTKVNNRIHELLRSIKLSEVIDGQAGTNVNGKELESAVK